MAGGMPGPAVAKIPVKQAAAETYSFVYEHRHRILRWAVLPLSLYTVSVLAREKLLTSETAEVFSALIVYLLFMLLLTLITVPFQVAIHRLAYPGFDFDSGSHGPPLGMIHKYYFIYTLIYVLIPSLVFGILITISSTFNIQFLSTVFLLVIFGIYIYVLVAFMLIFPQMAIGVKPSLVGAWWTLRGNFWPLVLAMILTLGPAIILSLVPAYLLQLFATDSFFLDAILVVIDSAFSLLTMALWASALSICYYYITGRQHLEGATTAGTGDSETT